jgi:hypothetical protein
MAVIRFRVGAPGSGKTYSFIWEILNEWITTNGGPIITNLPLRIPEIEAFCAEKGIICPPIHIIPKQELDLWDVSGGMSPLNYFADKEIAGAWIIIDEVHHFVSKDHKQSIVLQWQKWLGEIRHTGAQVDLCSQHEDKVAKPIRDHAAIRIELVNAEDRRDPYCGIRLWDWYQLKAKANGSWRPSVWRNEAQKVFGRWKITKTDVIPLQDVYFKLYDSYSAPVAGGAAGRQKLPWEVATWPQLIRWFIWRNIWQLFSRFFLIGVIFFLLCGGGKLIIDGFMYAMIKGLQPAPAANSSKTSNAVIIDNLTTNPNNPPISQGSATLSFISGGSATAPDLDVPPLSPPVPPLTLVGLSDDFIVISLNGKKIIKKKGDLCMQYTIQTITKNLVILRESSSLFSWSLGATIQECQKL